jgi:hypothetical protein
MLDLVEEAFDEVARFVQISAEADWFLAVWFLGGMFAHEPRLLTACLNALAS